MKLFKIKANESTFDFNNIIYDDNKLSEKSKNDITEYLNTIVEPIEYIDGNDFINVVTERLKVDDTDNVGNTIDVHTSSKNIYQMCYLEFSKEPLNYLATIMNVKRKAINGDVYVFSNSLLTTKIEDKSNPQEYISNCDMSIDNLIDIILNNFYFKGICFDGESYSTFIFDNNMKIRSPESLKETDLSQMLFRRTELLNFTIDLFFEEKGDKLKSKYNKKLSSFYIEDLKGKIFIALKSENEKKYNDINEDDEYLKKILIIYEKYCFDDDEIQVPRELKFYEYQDNDKYTNKYIVFDNLFDKIVLK
jgi:hypothetical protein